MTEICERVWWANLFYANNFITANGANGMRGMACMPVSWYLAGTSHVVNTLLPPD